MAGYKCVNFVDLCRLCASSGGGRTGIFSEEGKRKNILLKITDCLKIKVYEKDRLPKSVCATCLKQLEAHVEFRDSVVKAQGMLESCLNSTKLRNGGMVYIKDDTAKDNQTVTQMSSLPSPVSATITLPTVQAQPAPSQSVPQLKLVPAISTSIASQHQTATIATTPAMTPIIINSLPKGFVQTPSTGTGGPLPTATIMAQNSDFLSSIMQAVGIQTGDTTAQQQSHQQNQQQHQQQQQHPLAQYTITLDGQTIKANQIHYKIQDGSTQAVLTTTGDPEPNSSYQPMDEFLNFKTPVKSNRRESEKTPESVAAKKPKISVVIKSPPTPQATLVTTTPPKQTQILATTAPVATVASSPITLTPVSSTSSIASFSTAPAGTIFTSTPIASGSTTTTPVKSSAISMLDAKMMQGNKCIVPIMLKAEGGGEQIALAPVANVADMNKGLVQNVQYVQMKLQPGPDGMFRLAPTHMPPGLTLTPQGLQQFGISPLQTVQSQPTQQQQHHQQIQIQPQHIQAQLAVPSVQVPLSNYLSLVEKSSQLQNASELQSQQANIVISTQPVQQQTQQQQQQIQHMQIVQRPTVQVQAPPVQQTPPKPQKPNPPQPPPPPAPTSRRESASQEDQLNSSSESNTNVSRASQTAQSIAATQQMKAISALSLKQDGQNDHLSSSTVGKNTIESSSSVSFTSCDVCSKSFKRKEHLMQHLKSHVGLRPFKCDEPGCSKSFSRKEHLMRHIVSHTGKKMFACPVCRKYFSRKDNLNKHKKTHQENSSSAPFHCSICSKHFYIKGQFLRHKQMHDMAAAADPQKAQKKSPVKIKSEQPESNQTLPTLQQTHQQQPQQQQIQQVQLPTQHHHQQQQAQPQQQLTPVSIQSQQIFTIPAQLQNSITGKGPIIHQLQIAMPTSSAQQSTMHTAVSASGTTMASLAGLGGTGGGGGGGGATKTAIIKSADGSSATVYTIPSNFIIDGTQFLGAMQQSRELMGNIKIEQIT